MRDVAMFHVTTINTPPTKGAAFGRPPHRAAAAFGGGGPVWVPLLVVYLLLSHETLPHPTLPQRTSHTFDMILAKQLGSAHNNLQLMSANSWLMSANWGWCQQIVG